jgi:NADP-dependent 3-hydroxy acid dehydrogenase YdfG
MQSVLVARRKFAMSDQIAFAELSGDWNPIHVSAGTARRTQAGAPVVHGINGVLWALDELGQNGAPLDRLERLTVEFDKFLFLDREVELHHTVVEEGAIQAELRAANLVCTRLKLQFGQPLLQRPPAVSAGTNPNRAEPADPAPTSIEHQHGVITTDISTSLLGRMFPNLDRSLGSSRLRAVIRTTVLVGMTCPGLHSIFSRLDLSMVAECSGDSDLEWRTTAYDSRFQLVKMWVSSSGLHGEIQARVRPAPVEQPGLNEIPDIKPGEFADRVALIVGGTRGLGAATARIVAKGGGRVVITYFEGQHDAEALTTEITRELGDGRATALRLDVTKEISAQITDIPADLTHVYYFATPRIFRQTNVDFSRDLLEEFMDYYVFGFLRLCHWLRRERGFKKLRLLYPSSISVTERPRGMTEYTMAKAAGEVLATDLAKSCGYQVLSPRIDRTLTDQTTTIIPTTMGTATGTMTAILRSQT